MIFEAAGMMDEERKAAPGEDVEAQTRRRFAALMKGAAQQGEKLTGGAGVPDADDHGAKRRDWPEVWGPRVGRALGFLFALYLLWNLLNTYVMK